MQKQAVIKDISEYCSLVKAGEKKSGAFVGSQCIFCSSSTPSDWHVR